MGGMRSVFSAAVVEKKESVLHRDDFISKSFSKLDYRERDSFGVWTHLSISVLSA